MENVWFSTNSTYQDRYLTLSHSLTQLKWRDGGNMEMCKLTKRK